MSTRDVVKYIKGKKEIEVTYRRGDKEEKAKILLQSIDLKSVTSKIYKRDTKKIGYINVSIFASNTNLQFTTKLEELEKENIDSLIIDLRSNSGGYLVTAEDMISQFLDSSHVIYQIEKNEKKTINSKYITKVYS